jgi:hypothetical protein
MKYVTAYSHAVLPERARSQEASLGQFIDQEFRIDNIYQLPFPT